MDQGQRPEIDQGEVAASAFGGDVSDADQLYEALEDGKRSQRFGNKDESVANRLDCAAQ